jgi:hypothetical protein
MNTTAYGSSNVMAQVGSAQLNSSGTASITLRLGIGINALQAVYVAPPRLLAGFLPRLNCLPSPESSRQRPPSEPRRSVNTWTSFRK